MSEQLCELKRSSGGGVLPLMYFMLSLMIQEI